MITAELKGLHSPDISNLESYRPEDPTDFGFLLQMMAGPRADKGSESFDIIVCTPEWIRKKISAEGIVIGRHHLFVEGYDYAALRRFLEEYCASCNAESWHAVAVRLGVLGKWEFDDYSSARP